jgi:3-carboxy-cis,cis-muconate cycloisomerase
MQASTGLIPTPAAAVIEVATRPNQVDIGALRRAARDVGYPILSLIDQIARDAPDDMVTCLHWGATTEDITDTGLVL